MTQVKNTQGTNSLRGPGRIVAERNNKYLILCILIKLKYNIIPRSGLFPEDTIIEYDISDIDTIYSDAYI